MCAHHCNFGFYVLRKVWRWLPEVETCSLTQHNVFILVVLDGLYKYTDTWVYIALNFIWFSSNLLLFFSKGWQVLNLIASLDASRKLGSADTPKHLDVPSHHTACSVHSIQTCRRHYCVLLRNNNQHHFPRVKSSQGLTLTSYSSIFEV
jgi:hypothetical protein